MKEFIWPIERESLEDHYDIILNCAKCKYCQTLFPFSAITDHRFASQCTSGEFYRFESHYASGRLELARGIVEGNLEWSDRAREILYSCSLCGACNENCRTTQRLTPLKTIRCMRERFIKDKGELLPEHKTIIKSILKENNPYGKKHGKRFEWLDRGLWSSVKEAEVVLFLGCCMCYETPELAIATTKVLSKLGIKFAVLVEDERCCGAPLMNLGETDKGMKLLKQRIKTIEKKGISKVVFCDPVCQANFRTTSNYGNKAPSFEMEHITEFLLPILQKKSSLLNSVNGKGNVAYHDPSFLARHLRIHQEPREILKMIFGNNLTEMFRTRLNTFCSGGELTVKAAFPEVALSAADTRLQEAKAAGADTLVCADPHDYRNFLDVNSNLRIMDLMEVLLESLEGGN